MKGKIAFVLGAAVGYVLGTRAGRERYEQIKRGAQTVWETAPVQRGVQVVRDAAQARVDQVKAAAVQAGKQLLANATGSTGLQANGSASGNSGAPSADSSAVSVPGADARGSDTPGSDESTAAGADAGAARNTAKSGDTA